MREKRNPQLSLFMTVKNIQIGKELEQMSRIIDDTPGLLQIVFDDLVKTKRADTVPAPEKVVSIFEKHRDIIVKGQRDTTYGHKVFFTG